MSTYTKSGGAAASGPTYHGPALLYPGTDIFPDFDLYPGVVAPPPDAVVAIDTVAISVTFAPAVPGAVKTGGAAGARAASGARILFSLARFGSAAVSRTAVGSKALITLIKHGAGISARVGSGSKLATRPRTGGAVVSDIAAGPQVGTMPRTGGSVLTRVGITHRVRELRNRDVAATLGHATAGAHRDVHLTMFTGNPAPPGADLLGTPYVPPERRGLRFIARNIIDGRVVDWDVPLVAPEITWTLSGPTVIKGGIEPENITVVEEKLDAWATWLDVEENGIIRASGIMQPVAIADERFEIEAVGVAGYPQGLPFMSELSEVEFDALAAVRRIWAHLLSFPDAAPLNVELSQNTCGLLLGTPAFPKTDASGFVETDASGNTVMEDAKPYELNWWGDVDCGREIDQLARTVPFDYVERPEWSPDHDRVTHRIELGFPRVGRLRDDLRFVLDENMTEVFVVREQPGTYASQVIVRGAGEGRDGVRGYAGTRTPRRLRRVTVVTDKAVMTSTRADARAADELRRRQSVLTVGEITVHDWHPNAPIGSFEVGDDIVIQAPISYLGDVKLIHRIVSYTWSPDAGVITVELARSEDFYYSREPSSTTNVDLRYRPAEGLPDQEEEQMSDIPLTVAGNAFSRTVMAECGQSSLIIAQTWLTFGVIDGTAHFDLQCYGGNGATIGSDYAGDPFAAHGHRSVDLANKARSYMTCPNGTVMVKVSGTCSAGALPALGMVISPKK